MMQKKVTQALAILRTCHDCACSFLCFYYLFVGKQLALLETSSAVRTCGFDFSGNIIMFSTDKQMGYQCYLNFFDLRDPAQIGMPYYRVSHLPDFCLMFCCTFYKSLQSQSVTLHSCFWTSTEVDSAV